MRAWVVVHGSQTCCPACAASVRTDQRYCLECGERIGPPRVDWRSQAAVPAGPGPAHQLAFASPPTTGLRLPPPRTVAALVLAMLGTGILLGGAAAPRGADAARALSPTVVVMTPAPAPAPVPAAVPTPAPTDEPDPAPVEEDPAPADEAATASTSSSTESASASAPADDPGPEAEVTPEPTAEATPTPTAASLKHVWIVALRGVDVDDVAGDFADQGVTLANYDAVGTGPVSGGLALLGGRAPTPESDGGCATPDACLVPATDASLPGLLAEGGREWRAYVEAPTDPPCRAGGDPGDPVVWFRGLADAADCPQRVVALSGLEPSLTNTDLAPALGLLVPASAPADADPNAAAGAFLQTWIPKLTASTAYADGGLVAIVSLDGRGALVLASDGMVEEGATVRQSLDAYALARTIADAFALEAPGRAGSAEPFGDDPVKPAQ